MILRWLILSRQLYEQSPWSGLEGGFITIVVGELAFEGAVGLKLDEAVSVDLVSFVEAVPIEIGRFRVSLAPKLL
jgi:hypothetical protein